MPKILGELKALIELTFGDAEKSTSAVYIDARFENAALLNSPLEGVEPDVQVTIKPEYIIQFSQGNLDPRLGMFKDALFHEPSMPRGDIPKAVRFADLLTPSPPKPLSSIDCSKLGPLPSPTEDIDTLKSDVKTFGYG